MVFQVDLGEIRQGDLKIQSIAFPGVAKVSSYAGFAPKVKSQVGDGSDG
jgi:hypothetical protein